MGKVKLQYKTAAMRDAAKQIIQDRRRPYITGLRIYNIDELVKFALDNNYIEGAKYELAKGILKGAVEAERALVNAGNAVAIDGWVKYEPRLKGSVSNDTRALTKDNSLVMGITALKELKLTLDTFSWQLADEGFKPTPPDPDPEPEPEPEPGPAPLVLTSATTEGMDAGQVNDMEATSIAGTDLPTWGLDANDIVQMRGKNQEFVCANVQQITDTGNLVFNIDSQAHDVFENNDDVTFYVRIGGREGTVAAKWVV